MISCSLLLAAIPVPLQSAAEPAGSFLPALQEPGLPPREDLRWPEEDHFGVIRRLTTAGENAEGYFSNDGSEIVYQATVGELRADQIFTLDLLTGARSMVSTGLGCTTCAYFLPGDREVLFSSTHGAAAEPPPPADRSQGYVWKLHPEYELYVRNLETEELRPLAPAPGYDAEATVSPDGRWIVFTSRRGGDPDLYVMRVDGAGLRRLTDELGYDGGAFFSPDSQRIVYRAYHPRTEAERRRYQELLKQDVIEPMPLQLMVMDADGGSRRQITDNGAANFAPYWHPDGERIIYASNVANPRGHDFDLYLIRSDGTASERVTFSPAFDGFPVFSPDGRRLLFASNRANAAPRDTNLFLAEWIERPALAAASMR